MKTICKAALLATVFAGVTALLFFFFTRADHNKTTNNASAAANGYAFPAAGAPAGIPADSASLVENAHAWDEHIISFTGEAIGEAMLRGKMAWIHLNDDPYRLRSISAGAAPAGYNSGHAVWVDGALARQIHSFGDYKHQGDLVKVTGTFHAACRFHGGDMDIHAESLEVLQTGRLISHPFIPARINWALVILIGAGVLFMIKIIRKTTVPVKSIKRKKM